MWPTNVGYFCNFTIKLTITHWAKIHPIWSPCSCFQLSFFLVFFCFITIEPESPNFVSASVELASNLVVSKSFRNQKKIENVFPKKNLLIFEIKISLTCSKGGGVVRGLSNVSIFSLRHFTFYTFSQRQTMYNYAPSAYQSM
jgi:L-lactate permease